MNSGIVLAGQQPNYLALLDQSNRAAAFKTETDRSNAFNSMIEQNGAGILNGDQNALAALAGYDPAAALNIKSTQQQMGLRADEAARLVEEHAAKLSAAERAAEAEKIERAVAGGLAAQSPEQWDALMQQFGATDLVGQFDNREVIARSYLTVAEQLKAMKPANPVEGAPSGYMFSDPNNPAAGVVPLPGFAQEPKDEYGRYAAETTAAGQTPLSRLEYEQAKKGNGITVTNADGSQIQIGGKPADKMTESQAKANLFAGRMEASEEVIGALEAQGTSLWQNLASKAPGGNYLLTPEYQRYFQAKLDFLNAVLRQESGAVISAEEIAKGDLQYFPQPGDSEEVIRQKAANRRQAIAGIRQASGQNPGSPPAPVSVAPDQPKSGQPVVIDGYSIEVLP